MSSLRHLRSSTAAKRPAASGIADGQLAINTASGTPGLFFKNNASGVVKVGPAHVGATAPNATPVGSSGHTTGEMWLDTATVPSGLKVWNGDDWFTVNPSGTTTALGVVQFATVAETQSGVTATKAVTPSGLQSKLSDSINTNSSTSIASSAAVKTAYDLANSAIQASGGTMTGALEIGPSGSIIFEGSGVNTSETTISVVDPTADRTILFPDVSGNVVTTGDIGTVTGTMISGLTITNANIATSAAITDGKLATISGADKVSLSALNIDGATDINAEIADADLLIIDDGGAGTNRKTNVSRVSTYVFGKVSGDATISASGVVTLSSGVIVNNDINANAAIDLSKLATGALPSGITISSGNIVDGTITNAEINANAAIGLSKLATGALPTGITVTRENITSPGLLNADIASNAAIAHSKLASIASGSVLLGNASGIATATALSGDVTITSAGVTAIASGVISDGDISGSAAIGLSKLATGALPTGITVSSGNIVDGTITNAEINASAAISLSKLATGVLPSGITVNTSNIADLSITNSDISGTAAIEVGKISSDNLNAIHGITASGIIVKTGATTAAARTIVASGVGLSMSNGNGVSGNPTISSNATDANTANTIVARNASGNSNFSSVNKVAITAPASGSTLTIADGKTLTANNSITLAGTDSTTMTFPSSSATLAANNQTMNIGTTSVAINRVSANLALTGISSVALPGSSSGTVTVQPAAAAGTYTLTLPNSAGSDGQVLSTNGSGTLSWATDAVGFRNAIINGNFDIWQRGTSFTAADYGADRWVHNRTGTTHTVTRQAFTIGQTQVPNQPTYFCRTVVTSVAGAGNFATLVQKIEDVRTFAGQQVTISFWAKVDTTKNIAVELGQVFGSGGSPSTSVNGIGTTKVSIGTSWQKVTVTVTIPSISGKTLGSNDDSHLLLQIFFDAGSNFNARTDTLGQQSGTFEIAQVQVEPGPVATPFERRPIGTELALCQRYYQLFQAQAGGVTANGIGMYGMVDFKVNMRANPTITFSNVSTIGNFNTNNPTIGSIANIQQISFVKVATADGSGIYSFDGTASAEL